MTKSLKDTIVEMWINDLKVLLVMHREAAFASGYKERKKKDEGNAFWLTPQKKKVKILS